MKPSATETEQQTRLATHAEIASQDFDPGMTEAEAEDFERAARLARHGQFRRAALAMMTRSRREIMAVPDKEPEKTVETFLDLMEQIRFEIDFNSEANEMLKAAHIRCLIITSALIEQHPEIAAMESRQ